jgi:hypothetical protein
MQWWRSFGSGSLDYGSFLQQCADGGFAIAGLVSENTYDAYIVKTDENGIVTGVRGGDPTAVPASLSLSQNYPNPFNPTTTIKYDLAKDSHVDLQVFNILGQRVATLANEGQESGHHSVQWNASHFASGVYFYRLETGSFTSVKKLLLLK